MKIAVLSGSPKGETSVTFQYVRFMQKQFPEHEFVSFHISPRIKKLERDEAAFQEIVEQIRLSDGVLWAFPLYIMHVPANYKRFIELIWERNAQGAFAGKYAAVITTSIHFFDTTAHEYLRAICDDLDMRYAGGFSPEMRDLLNEEGQAELTTFAQSFFRAIEQKSPTLRANAPTPTLDFDYTPNPAEEKISVNGHRVLILTDAGPQQSNLQRMVERFRDSFVGEVEKINISDLDIKGSCLGCLRCGYDNQCAYADKDGYIAFYNAKVRAADILVFAGAIKDRYLSARWKTFFDRSFFNTHTPSLMSKQFVFLVSGPLSHNANLRQILEAWTELQHSNLVGYVSDEYGDSATIDGMLHSLAQDAVEFADSGYVKPMTFLGVGGIKIFRDDIWGRMRFVFQADHRAYKRLGIYDFPQKDLSVRALNVVAPLLLAMPRFREEFARRIKSQMIQPYQKVLSSQ